jgi:hypothetical protein
MDILLIISTTIIRFLQVIEMIEISKMEYYGLLIAEEKLDRLERGGVDNWDYYSDSIYGSTMSRNQMIPWDDFEEETKRKVWPNGV